MMKMIAIVSAILLAVFGLNITAPVTQADTIDDASEVYELIGTVEEITDEYYLILTTEGQRIQVNLYEGTTFDGETPVLGDLIHVFYNGIMTRSLPAQVSADHISCYITIGSIVELTQEGFTLDNGQEILEVHCAETLLTGLENGQQVKVYTNGIMTMSLPAQINAELILPLAE